MDLKQISIDIQNRYSSFTLFLLLITIDIVMIFIFLSGNPEQPYFINPKADYRLSLGVVFFSIFGFIEICQDCLKYYANKILICDNEMIIIWKNSLLKTKKQILNINDIELFNVKLIVSTIKTKGRYGIEHSHLYSETEVEIKLKTGNSIIFKEQPSKHLKKYNIKFFITLLDNKDIIPNLKYSITGNADFKINEMKQLLIDK